ncbi:hypothetical protein CaCOL14_013445 [Colletotrichum acutatum]
MLVADLALCIPVATLVWALFTVPMDKYMKLFVCAACVVVLGGVVLALTMRLAVRCPSCLRLIRMSTLAGGGLVHSEELLPRDLGDPTLVQEFS